MSDASPRRRFSRTLGGYALLWLAELAGAGALLTLPLWVVQLLSPAARPGSELIAGPAVLVAATTATTLMRSRLRAALLLSAAVAAVAVCAAVWPPPALAWVAAYAAARLLRLGAHALIEPPRAGRPGAGTLLLGSVGASAVARLTSASGSAAASLHLVAAVALAGALLLGCLSWLALLTGARRSPTLERLEHEWHARRLGRLARRGLRPLDPAQAPILYRRGEPAGPRAWTWEVRDGQLTVASGSARTRARAERAANQACLAHTFRPPAARAPGAFYVLAAVDGNPFMRQVVAIASGEPRAGEAALLAPDPPGRRAS